MTQVYSQASQSHDDPKATDCRTIILHRYNKDGELVKFGMPIENNTFYQISKDAKDHVTILERIGPDGYPENTYHPGPFEIIDKHGRTCTPYPDLQYTLTGGHGIPQTLSQPIVAPWSKTTSVNPNPTEGLPMLPPRTSTHLGKSQSTSYYSSLLPGKGFNGYRKKKGGVVYLLSDGSLKPKASTRFPGWGSVDMNRTPRDNSTSHYAKSGGSSSRGLSRGPSRASSGGSPGDRW